MKKLLSMFIICTMILTACGKAPDEKQLRIEIYSAQDNALITTVDDQSTANLLLSDSGGEELDELPPDLTPEYRLVVYQEKTLLLGQDPDEERGYDLIMTLTTYRGSAYIQESVAEGVVGDVLDAFAIPEGAMTFYCEMSDAARAELAKIVSE